MKKIRVLLIEDDADDIELLKDAFKTNNINCEIDVVMEGDKAIPYFEGRSELPNVIVMDLNLPKLHGKEILSQLKSLPNLFAIPIIILTTSASRDDAKHVHALGANKFITKPNTIQGFNYTIQEIVALAS